MNPAPPSPAAGPLAGRRIAVVVYSHYPSDPRPRREAETLRGEGADVEVISLMQDDGEPRQDEFNGIRITRVRLKKRRGGKLTYLAQYLWFILSAFSMLTARSLRRRFDLVHVHNMPDVLVFSALVPKLFGARVILDQHDPMPELMMSIYGFGEQSRAVRLLKVLERWSLGFADAVITVNLACKKIFTARSCRPDKLSVVMNAPDERIFAWRDAPSGPSAARDAAKPFVLMYHGSIVERHGLDLAVEALAAVRPAAPNAVLRIYGRSTPFLEQVMADVAKRGLQGAVEYHGGKNLDQIVAAIDECDVGVIPNRRSIFTEINTPTRIFEYLSRGKPVIAPDAGGITDYFTPDSLVLFELGNAADLAAKLAFAHAQPAELAALARRGQVIYRAHRWAEERAVLLGLVNRLLGENYPKDSRIESLNREAASVVGQASRLSDEAAGKPSAPNSNLGPANLAPPDRRDACPTTPVHREERRAEAVGAAAGRADSVS